MLSVDVAALRRIGAEIDAAGVALWSVLDDLDADARSTAAAWSGEAWRAYEERRAAWRRAGAELGALLREIGRAVEVSAADYADVEARNRALFD
ncbi:WXG100 family type VII secretion target [Catenuloplanes atrovinosus]|uniref:WXG100 family type VII secretion target n=1 Tax=Catenuloplanes atrovinosus TaxID=137266 RepID=A0AAE3YXE8_9ACTN|nr:WXG100 family type VII secretion target [Catenuloplanes atrovinosus]MDR7279681.1 WXG100 family type VII secretion target [Catenuloplanes atrovinosus]